jgi:hypothetical protein
MGDGLGFQQSLLEAGSHCVAELGTNSFHDLTSEGFVPST